MQRLKSPPRHLQSSPRGTDYRPMVNYVFSLLILHATQSTVNISHTCRPFRAKRNSLGCHGKDLIQWSNAARGHFVSGWKRTGPDWPDGAWSWRTGKAEIHGAVLLNAGTRFHGITWSMQSYILTDILQVLSQRDRTPLTGFIVGDLHFCVRGTPRQDRSTAGDWISWLLGGGADAL